TPPPTPPPTRALPRVDAAPDDGGMARRAYRRARVERPAEEAVAAEVEEAATATGAPGPGNAALARLGDQAAAAAASGVLSNAAAVRALAGTSGDREQAADRVADAVTGPFEVASGPVGGAVAGRAPGARGGDP